MDQRKRDRIEEKILDLLDGRGAGKTICPSEAVRQAFPGGWRDHMELCREVAVELAKKEIIEICQNGVRIPTDGEIHGPIRLRRTSRHAKAD